MAIKLINITDDAHQQHIVITDDQEITLTLRFLPVVQAWFFDVSYGGRSASGFRLALNVLHMQSQNFPFDFIVEDTSGRDIDPFRLDDFATGRCNLYMLQSEDMAEIRGQDVPV